MNTIIASAYAHGARYRDLVQQYGSPLLVLDARAIREQYDALRKALPGVDLYYAIKSLPHFEILNVLADLGAGFDMASTGELELIRDLHIAPRRTIHTHPIKKDCDIRSALRFGCTTFVIDNMDELIKFLPYKHRVGLFLRISFRSPDAVVDLSKKFGCSVKEAPELLFSATQLGIHVKGLCFHVGSQSKTARAHVDAIHSCNTLIRQHHNTGTAPICILDIGGGFPISYDHGVVNIHAYCDLIRRAISNLPPYVRVIAEPGRFISGPSMTCIATVTGKALRDGLYWYYLDDGVYGSFSGQIYDHMRYPLEIFSDVKNRCHSVLAGPTCDSIDLISEDVLLPEMRIGDLVVGHMMGAYTAASATEFNMLEKAQVVVVNRMGAPGAGAAFENSKGLPPDQSRLHVDLRTRPVNGFQ
jgi:ornithine decarboxylase